MKESGIYPRRFSLAFNGIVAAVLVGVGVLAALHWMSTPAQAPLLGCREDGTAVVLVPRFWAWVCYAAAWLVAGGYVLLLNHPGLWHRPTDQTFQNDTALREEYAKALEKAREEERQAREHGEKLSRESRRILMIKGLPLLSERLFAVEWRLLLSSEACLLLMLCPMTLAATGWTDDPRSWMQMGVILLVIIGGLSLWSVNLLRKGRWTLRNERGEKSDALFAGIYDNRWKTGGRKYVNTSGFLVDFFKKKFGNKKC